MSAVPCIVAVDVGNSAAKLAIRCQRGAVQQISVPIADDDWVEQVTRQSLALRERVAEESRSSPNAIEWRVASVRPSASQYLVDRLQRMASGDGPFAEAANGRDDRPSCCVRVITHSFVPMETDVEERERLGIDRLLGAFAAAQIRQPPLAVVDVGSAVTIDWVDRRGVFRGGAILPGLRLQLQSLARDTDALPEVDVSQSGVVAAPGRRTKDAISLGVVSGISSAIERLARQYAQLDHSESSANPGDSGFSPHADSKNSDAVLANSDAVSANSDAVSGNSDAEIPVILTGGDAPIIAANLDLEPLLIPDLVCRGILSLDLSGE